KFEVVDVAAGQSKVKLESPRVKQLWDGGWLAGGKELVGLATTVADRGAAGSEERVIVWDAVTGKVVRSVTHHTPMDHLAAAPDGKRFAEAGTDKMVRIRDGA